MADLLSRLKKVNAQWRKAEVRQRGALPDGRYQMRLETLSGNTVVFADRDGGIRARVRLVVVNGPEEGLEGRSTTKSWTLLDKDGSPNEISLSILKSDLATLGIDVESLDIKDVPDAIVKHAGDILDVTIRNREDDAGIARQDAFINGLAARAKDVKKGKKF